MMQNIQNISGILMDYGGTIDTNGVHWAEILWREYIHARIPINKSLFREAYRFGERTLALKPVIVPEHNFYDVLTAKIELQFQYITETGITFDTPEKRKQIADRCYALVRETIAGAVPTLKALAGKYTMVLISNFYGNINTVLKDFGIRDYFQDVIESAVVGIRKPDPAIFELGVKALNRSANHIVAIGDSYTKDIIPAKAAGCHTIWLKGVEWEETSESEKADMIIRSFDELPNLLIPNNQP